MCGTLQYMCCTGRMMICMYVTSALYDFYRAGYRVGGRRY